MDFKEDSTISDLRANIGQRCQKRTIRGWIYVGYIKSISLVGDEIFVFANTGVRGARDEKMQHWQCRLDVPDGKSRLAAETDDKKPARQEARAEKLKKEAADRKAKKLLLKAELLKRFGGQLPNSEA